MKESIKKERLKENNSDMVEILPESISERIHRCVKKGDVDGLLGLAFDLREQGREDYAEDIIKKAYEIEEQNQKEKSERILKEINREKELDK